MTIERLQKFPWVPWGAGHSKSSTSDVPGESQSEGKGAAAVGWAPSGFPAAGKIPDFIPLPNMA